MDDFKDVMLSDLPSGPLPVNYGTQQSMKHKQNVPQRSMALLDNYKGILLCDRPSDVKMQNVNPIPFLPAGPMENQMLGLQPSAEQRMSREIMRTMHSKCSKTTPGSTALLRHRKFLTQLNNTIRAKHEQATENLLRDAEKRTRFMSAQAIARLKSMNRVHSKDQPVNEQVENTARVLEKIPAGQNSIEQWTGEVVTSKSDTAQDPLTTEKDITCSKVPRKGSKPTWAMTAEEAEDYEQQEVEQLLRFAEGLDFTQFLNDLEVRDAFTRVRSRVEELMNGGINSNRVAPPSFRSTLVESKRCDIPTDKKDPDVGARSHVAEHQKPWDRSTAIPACDRMKREAVSTELLCLAEKILSKSEELREVYSKLALARLLQESLTSAMEQKGDGIAWLQSVVPHLAKASISQAAKKKVLPLEELAQPPPFLPPTIQSISACANSPHEAALLAMKDSSNAGMHAQRRILVDLKKSIDYVQNLPYLYRCPSI